MECRRYFFFKVLLPIVLGTGIYALFRGIHFIDPHEAIFPFLSFQPPDWFVYNLPDGLWLYALLSSIIFIWHTEFSISALWWIAIAFISSVFTEVLQLTGIISGTFDWMDIVAYSIAAIACVIHPVVRSGQLIITKQ